MPFYLLNMRQEVVVLQHTISRHGSSTQCPMKTIQRDLRKPFQQTINQLRQDLSSFPEFALRRQTLERRQLVYAISIGREVGQKNKSTSKELADVGFLRGDVLPLYKSSRAPPNFSPTSVIRLFSIRQISVQQSLYHHCIIIT